MSAQEELVAGLLEGGASWLRETDLGHIDARVMEQLEEHPVRTPGVAALVGFLVARRLR